MTKITDTRKTIKTYFTKAVEIIKTPKPFIKDLKDEKDIKISLRYLAFLFIVNSILLFGFSFVIAFANNPQGDLFSMLPSAVVYFAISGVIGFVITLFLGLIIHLYAKLFRGKAALRKSIQLYIYASTPTLLLGWLPIVGILASIYMLYLMYLGGMELHGFSQRKSLIVFIIIPIVLITGSSLVQLPQ